MELDVDLLALALRVREDEEVLRARERHVEHPHRVEPRHAVEWLTTRWEERANQLLDLARAAVGARAAQDDDRKLEPFALVDGEERDAPARERVFGVLVLALAHAEECEQEGLIEASLQHLRREALAGDERRERIDVASEELAREREVADGRFVDATVGEVDHLAETLEAEVPVEQVEQAPVGCRRAVDDVLEAERVVLGDALLVELLETGTAERAPRVRREARRAEERAFVRARVVGAVFTPAALFEHRFQRGVVALDGIQLRDALVDEAAQGRIALHQRVGDGRGAVQPRVELAVLASVEGLVARRAAQHARKETDDKRRLIGLEEALGARRVHSNAHSAQRRFEALDDGALERREQERDLVRIGDDLFVDEPTAQCRDLVNEIGGLARRGRHDRDPLIGAVSAHALVVKAELAAARPGPPMLGDERRVRLHDAAPGPVVDAELDAARLDTERARTALGELDEVFDRRATEPVERLVIVADDADVLRPAREAEEDALLNGVRVLVLVDDDVLEAVLRGLAREQGAVRCTLKEREVDAELA